MTLSDALAELYGDENSARRIAKKAGVDVAKVAFTGTAANTWALLLEEAQHQGRIAEVVGAALQEYPSHQPLVSALFSLSMPPPIPAKDGFMNPNIISPSSHESEAVVITRLAVQLENLTNEVKRVSDGLNSIHGLNVDRVERGLEDIAFMRGRMTTLTWAVGGITVVLVLVVVVLLWHL